MKQRRKMVNLLAAFIILIGGAFLILPEASQAYRMGCTATVSCGSSSTCSCTGYNCGFTNGGCYASGDSGGQISCSC